MSADVERLEARVESDGRFIANLVSWNGKNARRVDELEREVGRLRMLIAALLVAQKNDADSVEVEAVLEALRNEVIG